MRYLLFLFCCNPQLIYRFIIIQFSLAEFEFARSFPIFFNSHVHLGGQLPYFMKFLLYTWTMRCTKCSEYVYDFQECSCCSLPYYFWNSPGFHKHQKFAKTQIYLLIIWSKFLQIGIVGGELIKMWHHLKTSAITLKWVRRGEEIMKSHLLDYSNLIKLLSWISAHATLRKLVSVIVIFLVLMGNRCWLSFVASSNSVNARFAEIPFPVFQ